jgi:guanine nucleotide-binding protein subunit beta-2-like 1 protein
MNQAEGALINIEDLGIMKGHNGWVTTIVTGHSKAENEDSNLLITGGRDNTILVWSIGE